jgi:hypothetical protein
MNGKHKFDNEKGWGSNDPIILRAKNPVKTQGQAIDWSK